MPPPKPLTLCDPAQIDWSRPGTPAAPDYGDIYFSVDGGLDESRAVFLSACGLPDRWEGQDYFAIGELGFGTGLNFLACWDLWQHRAEKTGRLHFVSIEKHPLDKFQLSQALAAWPDLAPLATQLIQQWPGRVKGFHHLEFGDLSLTLIHDDIVNALPEISGKFDAWFLDGFSPSKNPDMWSPETMKWIAELSNPGARLGTFTVARGVRDALSEAGFEVEKKPGFGRKRNRLEARRPGTAQSAKYDDFQPVIIGSGIAGASLAHSFSARGIRPIVIDPSDGTAASGNNAAIIKPRLNLQDQPESRFFLSSYLHALQRYNQNTDGVLTSSISHICKDDKEQQRYAKLAAQSPLPIRHFEATESDASFNFRSGLVIQPEKVRSVALQGAEIVTGQAANSEDGTVYDSVGKVLATGTHVIWACGFGVRDLPQFADLDLRYSRGQISWAEGPIDGPVTYGGYAVPLGLDILVGATQKRLDEVSPFQARPDDDQENLDKYSSVFGHALNPVNKNSRSSVRVTTPTTLPMIFGEDREWGLAGLGSRGFVFAPLLAEAIVAHICGEVLPISVKVWTRFLAREKSNQKTRPK